MKIGKKTRLGIASGVAAAGAAAALLGNVSPAAAAYSSGGLYLNVKIGSPVTLVAKGAAVKVPITVKCKSNYGGNLTVQVTEAIGKKVATGGASPAIVCDGTNKKMTVTVPANGPLAFQKGQAYIAGYLSACGYATCGSDTGSATVKITAG